MTTVELETIVPTEVLDRIKKATNLFSNEPDMFKIEDQGASDYVHEMLAKLNKEFMAVDKIRMALTKPFRDHEELINDQFRKFKDFKTKTVADGKKAMGDYAAEKALKERELQAIEDAKARKKEESLRRRAVQADDSGHAEKAEDLVEQADAVQANSVSGGKAKGQTKVWDYEVTDLNAFRKHAAQDPYLINVLDIAPVRLRGYISDIADDDLEIPGLKISHKITFALRS